MLSYTDILLVKTKRTRWGPLGGGPMSSTAGTPLIAKAPQAPDEGGEKRSGIAVAMLRDQGGDSITRHLWFMGPYIIYGME